MTRSVAAGAVLAGLLLAGCAQASPAGVRVASAASAGLVMCKHCNCTMPAGLPEEAPCPVCKCKLRVRQCLTGER